jgi:hypothetical protein
MKEGGELVKILKSKSFGEHVKTIDFPDMPHGWVSRGNLDDPKTV